MGDPTRAKAIADLEALATVISGPLMIWSNEALVGIGAAVHAIEFFRSRGYVITGFEGFNTDGTYLMPQMDFIADFSSIGGSWSDRVQRSAEAAVAIVSRWQPGPQFITFTLQRPEENAP
jgi:hypothetical protein